MLYRKVILLIVLMVSLSAIAQNRVPNTPIAFELPAGQWKFLQVTPVDRNTNVYLYSFKARNVIDAEGDTVLPYMSIYVQQNYRGSIYDLVYSRYTKHPYQSLNEQSEGLAFNEAIAYVGAYASNDDGKVYEFRMLYFKHNNTAYEFRLETTADTFDEFDEAFKTIIESIKAER